MTRGFVVDTPDLDLDDQDLAILQNALNTNATRSEGPNHFFDASDLTRLKVSLNASPEIACDSENVQLYAPSIIGMKNAGLSGGGDYNPSWVHFDGLTYLSRASGLGDPSPNFLLSYWGNLFFSNGDSVDSALGATPLLSAGFNLLAGSTNSNDPPSPPASTVGIYVADSSFAGQLDFDTTDNALFDNGRYHVLIAANTNFPVGSRLAAVYVNDVLRPLTIKLDTGDAFNINYADSPVYWGTEDPGVKALVGDCTDPYINVVDQFLNSDGTIPENIRRLFITADGKPANPSGFPANGLYLGGNSTTFGSAAGFTVTAGSLTDVT